MSSGKLLFERLAVTLPAGVNAVMTTRKGGVSAEVYSSFNLADHVGDDKQAVGVAYVKAKVLTIDHRVGAADEMAGLDTHPALGPDAGVAQVEVVRLNGDAARLQQAVRLLQGRHW